MQPSLLFDQGGGNIPYSETFAPGQDVRISSVNAKWNGAAASGTFLACLSLYSQSGVLLSRSFPSQQFAAGDSGVVTYAPPLGASAGGAAPTVTAAYAFLERTTNYSVAPGSDLLPWETFATSDLSNFATDTGPPLWPGNNAAGDYDLIMGQPGIYLAEAFVRWENGVYDRYSILESTADGAHGVTGFNTGTGTIPLGADYTGDVLTSRNNTTQSGSYIGLRVYNGDAVARNVEVASLKVTFLGGSFLDSYASVY